MTVLTKQQFKTFVKTYTEGGTTYRMTVTVRHDDRNGNGHNTFSITCDVDRKARNGRWVEESAGAMHDGIARRFPNLAPFIQWHLCSTDGPLHYIANTLYWVRQGNLEYARKTAIWPEATLDDLTNEQALRDRFPALMAEFRQAVESLGFEY